MSQCLQKSSAAEALESVCMWERVKLIYFTLIVKSPYILHSHVSEAVENIVTSVESNFFFCQNIFKSISKSSAAGLLYVEKGYSLPLSAFLDIKIRGVFRCP